MAKYDFFFLEMNLLLWSPARKKDHIGLWKHFLMFIYTYSVVNSIVFALPIGNWFICTRFRVYHPYPEKDHLKGVMADLDLYSTCVHDSQLLTLPLAASLRHLAATHREVTAGSNSCCRIMASRRRRKLPETKQEALTFEWQAVSCKKSLLIIRQREKTKTKVLQRLIDYLELFLKSV